MKIVTSVLTLAATAGLALLALTSRKVAGDAQAIENVGTQASGEESTSVPAAAESWFV